MKKIFLIFFPAILFFNGFAINDEQALLVAKNFLKEKNIEKNSSLFQIFLREIVRKEETVLYYILSLGNNEGFVILSASEYVPPIVGFSLNSEFEWQPAIQFYLDSYATHILQEENSKKSQDENIKKLWNYYLQENFSPKVEIVNQVSELITSHWNQNQFYNTYCPWTPNSYNGYDNRVPNGCVALATAQLMNYYRHPETGRNGVSYKPGNYPLQTVYFSQHQYHWDAMCDRATNYTNEIAKLAYHLGVAVKMQYSPSGSGAYTEDAAIAMRDNFYYTNYEVWAGEAYKLKEQLDLLQPVLMSGNDGNSGHAFLVDGYIETIIADVPTTLFHFNWGWGGAADAYLTLNENPFMYSLSIYTDLKPATNYPVQCQQFKKQTAFEGYVTNGSTNKPYQSNPDCSWIIAAPGAKQYKFSFARLDTEENIDEITIYNGSEKSSGVAAKFSGTTTPNQSISVDADSVLITFTSNNPNIENTTHRGFLMNYVTNKPQQKCNTTTNLSASTGYITDGTAPGENYTPWISCTWNIRPNNITGFFGLFYEFDLKLGDFIDIYDATRTTPYFWKRYDRYSLPTIGEVISIPYSKIQIKFITDNFEEGNGFKFQYFSILGVNDNSLLDNLTIFPNPASDVINISFSSELENQNINCSIIDVMGKEVYSSNIEYCGAIYEKQIPVAHLSKGFYFLQLVTTTGKTISKIVIN